MERLKVGTDEVAIHVSSDALLATEVTIPAGGGPSAMHRHPSEELYRVESGELAIYVEDRRIVAIKAAPEPLAEITASGPNHLLRVAWHLGNRHLPTEALAETAAHIYHIPHFGTASVLEHRLLTTLLDRDSLELNH